MSAPTYLVFDTETTGLPVRAAKGQPPVAADDPRQPRLASYAAIVTDAEGIEISRQKFYVRPVGWTMAEFDALAIADGKKPASEVNGLTDALLLEKGVPVDQVLGHYVSQIDAGLIVVAFNAVFDTKIMRGELRRAGHPDMFEETRNICAMKALKPYIAEGLYSGGFGNVSLTNACEFFGIVNAEAHDAMGDAEAARAVLEILIRDGRCPAPGITLSKHKQAS
jgi:DNA polymerase III subunit epsilon